jgi:Restriction endonuclease
MKAKRRSEKTKGDFLEDLVALLHELPACKVERRVRVPVPTDPSESREIDVLLTGTGLGYPLRRAIECKNWSTKVNVETIEAFLSKLGDIEIPVPLSIFVSASGYTRGAIRRGVKAGLRLLEVTGLSEDRLSSAAEKAFQYPVYLVPIVELVQQFGDRSGSTLVIKCLRYQDPKTGRTHYALDNLWKKWLQEEGLRALGLHHIRFDIPQDSSLFGEGEAVEPRTIFFGLRVVAAVVELKGAAVSHALVNAKTREVEKHRLRFDFRSPSSRVKVLKTEAEVQNFLTASGATPKLVISGIPLPRLIYMHLYWPPTAASLRRTEVIQSRGESPTLENVESGDLSQAWNFLLDGDSLAAIPDDIPVKVYPRLRE